MRRISTAIPWAFVGVRWVELTDASGLGGSAGLTIPAEQGGTSGMAFLRSIIKPAAIITACVMAAVLVGVGLVKAAEAMAWRRAAPEAQMLKRGIVSNDGRHVIVLRDDGAAAVETVAGEPVGVVRGHRGEIIAAHMAADGRLATVDATGRMLLTSLDGLGAREAAHGEALGEGLEQGLWDATLKAPAEMLWSASLRHAPWSDAKRIMEPEVVAPLLPPGMAPPPGTMFRDCEECPQMVVVPAGSFVMGSPGKRGRP